jgi:heme-degrading monooxygenase HmoA
MTGRPYTLGSWRVQPGREAEFVQAWLELAEVFKRLAAPPGEGMLLQSVDDTQVFYSVGDWPSLDAIHAMRADPDARAGLARLAGLCSQGRPGIFRVVATASGADRER